MRSQILVYFDSETGSLRDEKKYIIIIKRFLSGVVKRFEKAILIYYVIMIFH